MKNLLLIVFVICFTVFSGYLMASESLQEKDLEVSKHDSTNKKTKEKPKRQQDELQIENKQDLAEIIYSDKDEEIKMGAYNKAVEKGILPRSNNYQEAVNAYEESVWMEENQ